MSNVQRTGILGVGYQVPSKTRSNDDPVFDYLKKSFPSNHPGFQGFENRYVLDDDQTLTDLMVQAAQLAMKDANVTDEEIDALAGYASVSEYIAPNELAHVHRQLNLSSSAWVLPVSTEHGNFLESLLIARSLVQAGQARNVLIVCGGNWTRYVNYQCMESFGASDGAGAVVYGLTDDESRFELIDAATYQKTDYYDLLCMRPDPVASAPGNYTSPVFHIDPQRAKEGFAFAENTPPQIINALLKKNKVSSSDIALITHQTLAYLMEEWNKQIAPGYYINSMDKFANMTLATLPVNLAYFYKQINKNYLVFLSLGIHLHTTALLLKRNTPTADQPE